MRTLTEEQLKRVKSSLEETKQLLAKEMKISEDLRYVENVEFYKKHILKLENMLKTKIW